MAEFVAGVNPEILKWARERSGHSRDEVASALKKDVKVIENWESGSSAPTYVQLEKLAYQLYKRPIAIFFFPKPPVEPDPRQSFRTLPEFELDNLSVDTRYALRQGKAMQLALGELNDGENPSEQKFYRDIQVAVNINIDELLYQVRNYLGIQLEEQKSWKNTHYALKSWRNAVEGKGIFIFKRSFKQNDISGFSLIDDEFPIIYLNNSTVATRQIFTIFHELSHILLQTNGITKQDDHYIHSLTGDAKEKEVFCNRFAAEFLVPSSDFEQWLIPRSWDDETVGELASKYKVSRELILRKLLDRKLIDREYYLEKVKQLNKEFEENKKSKSGGRYYATQATYLGDKFLNLAFGRYYQGRCTMEQLADYLNIRVKSVAGLEQYVLRKAS